MGVRQKEGMSQRFQQQCETQDVSMTSLQLIEAMTQQCWIMSHPLLAFPNLAPHTLLDPPFLLRTYQPSWTVVGLIPTNQLSRI